MLCCVAEQRIVRERTYIYSGCSVCDVVDVHHTYIARNTQRTIQGYQTEKMEIR